MSDGTVAVLYILFLVVMFLLPTWIAMRKGHPHKFAIFVANITVAVSPALWFAVLVAAMYGQRFKRR